MRRVAVKKRVDGHALLFAHPKVTGRSRGHVIAYQIRCQRRTPVVFRRHSLRYIGKNIRGCVRPTRVVGEEPELSHPRVAGCWWNHEDSLRLDRAGCRITRRAAHPVDELLYSRGVASGTGTGWLGANLVIPAWFHSAWSSAPLA